MSFAPVVPMGGYAGWSFLSRTMEAQQQVHARSSQSQNDTAYFRENIGQVTSAEDLVSDYRLLKVALTAFGLQDDISNKFFIQKVLSEGTLDPESLANKLTNPSYRAFSDAFGLSDTAIARTQDTGFADEIIAAFETRSFEVAVGTQNDSMRLALNLERELSELAASGSSDETKWFSIMGSEPLRRVFETAFGLPSAFATLDLDRQLEVFRDKSESLFGSADVAQFQDKDRREELLRQFLVRDELQNSALQYSPAQTALTLLQAGR